ncbi:hypothetical protein JZ751_010861, partial [Albula glossodonta]
MALLRLAGLQVPRYLLYLPLLVMRGAVGGFGGAVSDRDTPRCSGAALWYQCSGGQIAHQRELPGLNQPGSAVIRLLLPYSGNKGRDASGAELRGDVRHLHEHESPSGRRKALATGSINMKQYASPMPTQTDVKLKFKPLSKKVVAATLQFSLSCIFLREGKATDEDMQSLASLMSMKQADIGNLDDFEEENEEDEENRVNQEEKAAEITVEEQGAEPLPHPLPAPNPAEELISKLNFLDVDQVTPGMSTNPFEDPDDNNELNPFGDPDEEGKEEEPFDYQDSSNPFNESQPETPQYLNPFDEPEAEPDPQLERVWGDSGAEHCSPKPTKKKNVHPVDMSKYLYAHTSQAEEEELDESNPFFEPKTSTLTGPLHPSPESSLERRKKRKAPAPPGPAPAPTPVPAPMPAPLTPKTAPDRVAGGPAAVAAVVGKELASSSPKRITAAYFWHVFRGPALCRGLLHCVPGLAGRGMGPMPKRAAELSTHPRMEGGGGTRGVLPPPHWLGIQSSESGRDILIDCCLSFVCGHC